MLLEVSSGSLTVWEKERTGVNAAPGGLCPTAVIPGGVPGRRKLPGAGEGHTHGRLPGRADCVRGGGEASVHSAVCAVGAGASGLRIPCPCIGSVASRASSGKGVSPLPGTQLSKNVLFALIVAPKCKPAPSSDA